MRINNEYSLVITTDSYAGNFERELSSWLLGAYHEHCDAELDHVSFDKWCEENPEHAEAVLDVITCRPYEEYGFCPCGLDPADANGLEIYLDRYIVEDENRYTKLLAAIKARIGPDMIYDRYVKDYSKYPAEEIKSAPIKILKIALRTTKTEESDVIIAQV